MKKVSYIFAAALIIEVLTSCGGKLQGQAPAEQQKQAGPSAAKVVAVRVDSQNHAEFINLDSAPSQQDLAGSDHNWKSIDNTQVITNKQGYPVATDNNAYFVQHPKDFVAQTDSKSAIAAYYGGRGGCGYCNYPNYGGYGGGLYNHYYYPNYYNYSPYYYLPTYYNNYSYWYYQPTYYYPTYYGYNYYIYSTWW